MGKTSASTNNPSPWGSLAEAQFAKTVQEALNDLSSKLPSNMTPKEMATRMLDFMELGQRTVHYRAPNGKVLRTTCLDFIEQGLIATDRNEKTKIVEPFWKLADFSLLQEFLFDLREKAQAQPLKWEHAEPVLRKILNSQLQDNRPFGAVREGKRALQRWTPTASRGKLPPDPKIAARLAVILQVVKSDPRPSHLKVCKRLDLDGIDLPDGWTNKGVRTWQEAYKKLRQRVDPIISRAIRAVKQE
jgi:hypothetical protein